MDDLLGEDWRSSPKQPSTQSATPAAFASNYSSQRATPQPNSSSAPSPFNLSRPSSTTPSSAYKSPSNASKPSIDAFGNLTTLKAQKPSNGTGLSIQERQRLLAEEKQKQLQEQGRLWDHIGARAKSDGAAKTVDSEDDILAAFNKDAVVDKSSHFPPPDRSDSQPISGSDSPALRTQPQSVSEFNDDDDTFGLMDMAKKSNGHATTTGRTAVPNDNDDYDILGDLSRPVAARSHSDESEIGWDENVAKGRSNVKPQAQDRSLAELMDMGFPEDTAALALKENGGNVQQAVGWLLQQAHEEAKQKANKQPPSDPAKTDRSSRQRQARVDDNIPQWMKQESRSSSGSRHREPQTTSSEKDASLLAQEFGSKLFRSANSLWKAGQKQVAKKVADLQQERDPSQPKWMQSTQSESSSHDSTRPSVTNEAALLDMPRDDLPIRTSKTSPSAVPMPANTRDRPQKDARVSPAPLQDRRPASKLSRQDVEEQSAQAYISPARRKKTQPQTLQTEPEGDLFSPAPAKIAALTAAPPAISKAAPRVASTAASRVASTAAPKVPQLNVSRPPPASSRNVPAVSAIALSASANHRRLGTEAFKRGDYSTAYDAYTAALHPLPATHPVIIVVLSNRSLTALKTGDAKTAVSDADRALDIIGPGLGSGEIIELGESEGNKDMREFYGKALMRKAEALEHLEKWSEAANVWRLAVEAGVGGAVSLRGKDRCDKAANPAPARAKPATNGLSRAAKPPPAKSLGNSLVRPALTTPTSDAAVKKLREANAAAAKADDEKFELADKVDAQLTAWKGGKADNLRALLQSLDAVLWESAGWKKVGMSDLVMPNKVKIIYMKAIAKVHPDKIAQDASTEQRMISGAVFSILNEAWDKFKKDNNL